MFNEVEERHRRRSDGLTPSSDNAIDFFIDRRLLRQPDVNLPDDEVVEREVRQKHIPAHAERVWKEYSSIFMP